LGSKDLATLSRSIRSGEPRVMSIASSRGEKPADMPDLKTAKTLGPIILQSLLATADE